MKYIVSVAGKTFEVEIEDIQARPVIARVDGQEFKVSLEESNKSTDPKQASQVKPVELPKQLSGLGLASDELTAPLPGTVIEVFFKPGEQIEAGQVVLIIEAMKMKNSIRSTRAGRIADVLVSAGQTVTHKQVLMRFE